MTYGSNSPLGLVPVYNRAGSPYNGSDTELPILSGYATSIFTGDPVATQTNGTIGQGVGASVWLGVFMGCKYVDSTGLPKFSPYWPASTSVLSGTTPVALIADAEDLLFDVQEANHAGTAAGTPLTQTAVGDNTNFVIGTGTTANGLSATWLDNSVVANTSTLNVRIQALSPKVGNVLGAFANWLVSNNSGEIRPGTTGHS